MKPEPILFYEGRSKWRINSQPTRLQNDTPRELFDERDPCRSPYADSVVGRIGGRRFAGVTGPSQVQTDPETVLSDLLGDHIHWCDAQKTNGGLEESIDFESALERARNHYNEECADAREQLT